MLTQVEIDGFKTFKGFKVELAPFQVIVGPNGSGKSNLFDALQLLSRLAEKDLLTAFQEMMRGDADDLFTKFPDGTRSNRIRLAAELLIEHTVEDDFGGKSIGLRPRRLRYEVEVTARQDEYDLEGLYITHELLRTITQEEDSWGQKYIIFSLRGWEAWSSSSTTFIDTGNSFEGKISEYPVINIYRERANANRRSQQLEQIETHKTKRTALSGFNRIRDAVLIFAARQELRSLRLLHLNPEVLRQPSSMKSPDFLSSDGRNLAAALARIEAEDPSAFRMIAFDMSSLVPDILDIKVERDKARSEYKASARTSDQRTFSAQLLSDGTLRLLALAMLKNDPQFRGILCLEEPENGVQPLYLKKMARLLRAMATDLRDPEQVNGPLRQVLITTHSALFISQPEILDSLLLTITPTYNLGKGKKPQSMRITRIIPVLMPDTPRSSEADTKDAIATEAYTIDMVREYLDGQTLDQARDQLKEARAHLFER
jgi:predicted ATPase